MPYKCIKCRKICRDKLHAQIHFFREHNITLDSREINREFRVVTLPKVK